MDVGVLSKASESRVGWGSNPQPLYHVDSMLTQWDTRLWVWPRFPFCFIWLTFMITPKSTKDTTDCLLWWAGSPQLTDFSGSGCQSMDWEERIRKNSNPPALPEVRGGKRLEPAAHKWQTPRWQHYFHSTTTTTILLRIFWVLLTSYGCWCFK